MDVWVEIIIYMEKIFMSTQYYCKMQLYSCLLWTLFKRKPESR